MTPLPPDYTRQCFHCGDHLYFILRQRMEQVADQLEKAGTCWCGQKHGEGYGDHTGAPYWPWEEIRKALQTPVEVV